jgi:CheY-like chemotaxis protein
MQAPEDESDGVVREVEIDDGAVTERIWMERRQRGWMLVVDDSADARAFYEACLEPAGIDLVSASNGQEALWVLLDRPPPVAIVLDLLMPEMSGFELMEVLRGYNRLADIPVVFVTALDEAAAPAADFGTILRKPIAREQLLASLEHATGR